MLLGAEIYPGSTAKGHPAAETIVPFDARGAWIGVGPSASDFAPTDQRSEGGSGFIEPGLTAFGRVDAREADAATGFGHVVAAQGVAIDCLCSEAEEE